jgi:hypothetical protein
MKKGKKRRRNLKDERRAGEEFIGVGGRRGDLGRDFLPGGGWALGRGFLGARHFLIGLNWVRPPEIER